jgi:hypothetical protein
MDAQTIHEKVVSDYKNYIKSFINISDEEIRREVSNTLEEGKLWPDPLYQFNPSFEKSGSLSELVEQGLLHNEGRNNQKLQIENFEPEGVESLPLLIPDGRTVFSISTIDPQSS